MTDTTTPTPTPATATAAPQKRHVFENVFIKFIISLIAWGAPLPVSVVALNFWYAHYAPEEQRGIDPFQSIRHSMASWSGSSPDIILAASILPSALLLAVLYRSMAGRTLSIAALAVFAVAEFIGLSQIQLGLGAP